jgi:hypothetical protein
MDANQREGDNVRNMEAEKWRAEFVHRIGRGFEQKVTKKTKRRRTGRIFAREWTLINANGNGAFSAQMFCQKYGVKKMGELNPKREMWVTARPRLWGL